MKNCDNYIDGSGSATVKTAAHYKHPEEEETSPNRNHIITRKQDAVLIFAQNIDCGYSFNKTTTATEALLTRTHNLCFRAKIRNQRTNGPVNTHLISWPSKAQNIQNMENITETSPY